MIVLICGGRNFTDHGLIVRTIKDMINRRGLFSFLDCEVHTVIHGAARGADRMAGIIAGEHGLEVLPFPARWKKHGAAAGPIRNQEMLDEGKPDLVVAFQGGKGTADMVCKAQAAGIRVIHVAPF